MTTCPFNKDECSSECAMYISPDELNELVTSRLASIGVMKREQGQCSLKQLALVSTRYMFEKTSTNRF